MKNFILTIALTSTIILPVISQNFTEKLYQCYVQDKMDEWLEVLHEMESKYKVTKSDRMLFDLTHAYYGYIGYCIISGQSEKAVSYIEKGEKNLDYLLEKYPKWSEVYALRGAYYGFRMSIHPYKAIYLGPKSMSFIQKAIELDRSSPYGYVEKANAEYHMPSAFGGSRQEAIKNYQEALRFFEEKNKTRTWIYLNTCLNLAKVYENTSNYRAAVEIYRKILRNEPEFSKVKNSLLPSALKKSSNFGAE